MASLHSMSKSSFPYTRCTGSLSSELFTFSFYSEIVRSLSVRFLLLKVYPHFLFLFINNGVIGVQKSVGTPIKKSQSYTPDLAFSSHLE